MGWTFRELDELGDIINVGIVALEIIDLMEEERKAISSASGNIATPQGHFYEPMGMNNGY
ncbi:MAG: hypothetical protein ACREPR_14290 [Brasilonema sp.]